MGERSALNLALNWKRSRVAVACKTCPERFGGIFFATPQVRVNAHRLSAQDFVATFSSGRAARNPFVVGLGRPE